MADIPAEIENPLLAALKELDLLVAREPRQPLNQMAEETILNWIRVVDGQEIVQPRLNEQGYAPTAFHFGMGDEPHNRLDDCGMQGGDECFESVLEERLAGLRARLEGYFSQSGYRSSSEQCDQVMLDLTRLSRFVNAWAREGELRHGLRWSGRNRAGRSGVDLYDPSDPENFLLRVRRQLAIWEPLLNAGIVAWEENLLEPFDRALEEIRQVLLLAPGERISHLSPPGFPLRRRGSPRQKISVFEPDQRPLRGRSVYLVRSHQLAEKISGSLLLPAEVMEELRVDVEHFSRMVRINLFMLASPPGFLRRGRAGVPTIRGQPSTHPFLLDPTGFFKKAVLFHNGTYSREGGGLDAMFLDVRRLERLAKFESWGDWTRPLRGPIENAVICWEENRWREFTEALVEVAEIFRRQAEGEVG